MRRCILLPAVFGVGLFLQGCLARTALDVVTAPVKAVGQVADWATTSQDEADRNRGRELREAEERLGKLERRYRDQLHDCERGDEADCDRARATRDEIEGLRATLPPVLPDD